MNDGVVVMTIRAETPETTLIFRASVEQARRLLPDLPLLVVDDCSPDPAMQTLLTDWDAQPHITVIRMGPPVKQGHYARVGLVPGETCSFGHAPSLDRGLWVAGRHRHAPWAFVLDGDVFGLADDWQAQVRQAASALRDDVCVVGEWVGTPEDWTAEHVVDAIWHQSPGRCEQKALEPVAAAIRAYGYVNMMASVVNLQAFWDPYVQSLQNTGWVANQWFYAQMARGRQARYYPFFRNSGAVHLGAVAVATTQGETFGNLLGGRRYGQRDEGNYYAGYLQVVDCTTLLRHLAHRGTRPVEREHFTAPAPAASPWVSPYLRYQPAPATPYLYADQRLGFAWVARDTDQILATAEVTLAGPVCEIRQVLGVTQTEARACYEAVFEHIPALQRTEVRTPLALVRELGLEREIHAEAGDQAIFYWRYFSRGLPQWRWAEHYGWGRSLLGPLAPPTR